jgi:ABC-type lipoprotein release transport system permease subunit
MRLAGFGLLVGSAAALGAGQLLQSQLFGVSPRDPATFAAIALLLGGVAFLASWLPARRAAAVDPLVALRCE